MVMGQSVAEILPDGANVQLSSIYIMENTTRVHTDPRVQARKLNGKSYQCIVHTSGPANVYI